VKNVWERAMSERKSRKAQKLVPIIYIKGSCYETPLYDHVLGDKRDSDKDEV
jgi:hypothetical protein